MPSVVESKFTMAQHSFAFANFAHGHPDSRLDDDGMVRMFGASNVCLANSSPCVLNSVARSWLNRTNAMLSGGRCEGFAVTSALLESGDLSVVDFGAESTRALRLNSNVALEKELAYWSATQAASNVVATQTKALFAKDAMPFLAKALQPDAPERYRLGIAKKSNDKIVGGHALTPIGYYADSKERGVYWLRVYDSNNPDTEQRVRIDTVRNEWQYEAARNPAQKSSLFVGNEANANPMYFTSVKARLGELPCPFCTGAQVVTKGGVQATVDDGSGATGVQGGQLSSRGSSSASMVLTGLEEDPPDLVVTTGASEHLDVVLAPGVDAETASIAGLDVFGPNFTISIDGLSLKEGADDQLHVTGSATSLTYENGSRSSLSLGASFVRTRDTLGLTTQINGGSSNLSTTVDPRSGALTVKTLGAAGSQVTIVVSHTDDITGTTRSGQVTFVASTDAGTVTVNGDAMAAGGTLQGTIDDGTGAKPLVDACSDGVKSGLESDIDCGSSCTTRCAVGAQCTAPADCASTACNTQGRCVATSCEDGVTSMGESDVDCGGTCGPCALSRTCRVPTDCASGGCMGNVCVPTFRVGVSVSGLMGGSQLLLQNNGADDLGVLADGSYAFATPIVGSYAVSIRQQPSNVFCTLQNASGTASATTLVTVTCLPAFQIGGSVTGLPSGGSLTLSLGAQTHVIGGNGSFVFDTGVVAGTYEVSISQQPTNAVCSLANGSLNVSADVTNVAVTCVPIFVIGGTVTGLPTSDSVTLLNNGGDAIVVSTNTSFAFSMRVTNYVVTVGTQPTGARCRVTNGTGMATATVNVQITCFAPSTIGGTVSGLPAGDSLDLNNYEGLNPVLHVTSNGPFTLPTPALDYLVGVQNLQSTSGAVCVVSNERGVAFGPVTDIQVRCGYIIGGTLETPGTSADPAYRALVQLNGGEEVLTYFGAFSFNTPTQAYSVTISRNPRDARCFVVNGVGTATGPVTSISVTCNRSGGHTPYAAFNESAHENEFTALVATQANAAVLVGRDQTTANNDVWSVQKLNADGTFVTAFGTAGIVTIDRGTGLGERANAIVSTPDGGLIVAGTFTGTNTNAGLVKLSATGAFDSSFGINGIVDADLFGTNETVTGLVRLADGSLVITGATGSDLYLAKYSAAGVLDSSFGTGGKVTFGAASTTTRATALVADTSNHLFVVGSRDARALALRFDATTGVRDTSYGGAAIDLSLSGRASAILSADLNAAGQLVVGGWATAANATQPLTIARLTALGQIDTSFGAGGVYTGTFSTSTAEARGVKVQPGTDRVYFVGASDLDFVVGRLTAAGLVDPDFFLTTDNFQGPPHRSYMNALAFDGPDYFFTAGSLGHVTSDFGMVRFFQ